MLIFAIDDERNALLLLHMALAEAAPRAKIMDFSRSADALRAIEGDGLSPDFVFSDIRMPGIDGLKLAARVKKRSPQTRFVFVTGYTEYAYDAMRLHVNGYIKKPVSAESVRAELLYSAPEQMLEEDKLRVRCFGYFEVFWQGRPLIFHRRQTKELLAFLIDREGEVCTAEQIIAALWEGETDVKTAKHRLRQLIGDMRDVLTEIGMQELLVRSASQAAIRRDMVDCDYYRMLDGDMDAVNAFHGEYMSQYSWAELTEGRLHFRNGWQ